LDDDRALAKVGHHWLGLDDNTSGTLYAAAFVVGHALVIDGGQAV